MLLVYDLLPHIVHQGREWGWNQLADRLGLPRVVILGLSATAGAQRPLPKIILPGDGYSADSETYELYINGKLQVEGKAIGSLATNASHIIGCDQKRERFFFNGSISKIVVYDHMLSRDAFRRAASTLMTKYSIDPSTK